MAKMATMFLLEGIVPSASQIPVHVAVYLGALALLQFHLSSLCTDAYMAFLFLTHKRTCPKSSLCSY